ncbi:MAG: hypothetical protein M3R54_04495 [Chloroflexota bacterium]|nr:hypothetical protein [Chloroflexota bacterium]
MPGSDRAIAAYLAVAAILLYLLSGLGHPTVYDYDARLAVSFTHGQWWLDDKPSWLIELVPCGAGRYCVHLAPLPALLVMPFLLLAAGGQAQTIASAVIGGLIAAPTFLTMRSLGAPRAVAIATVVFAVAGTTMWFDASDGRAWFFAHAAAVLFASLAVLAALRGAPGWAVALLLGIAALARLPIFLAAPGLALLVARRRGEPLPRVVLGGALGLAPFAAVYIAYNLLRWNVPWDAGYLELSSIEPWYTQGLFNLGYIPRHLYAMLVQAPDFVDGTVFFVRPTWLGTSLLLVSPALVYAVRAIGSWRVRSETLPLLLAAILAFAPDATFAATGFAQFGYRYFHDAQAFVIPLVAVGGAWRGGAWVRPSWMFLAAVALSVAANLYGVVAITHFNYIN